MGNSLRDVSFRFDWMLKIAVEDRYRLVHYDTSLEAGLATCTPPGVRTILPSFVEDERENSFSRVDDRSTRTKNSLPRSGAQSNK